jgi:asparagine synthase (glutamine-hydrolysing)
MNGGRKAVVLLSGGLDSSSIAVLAARELRRQGRPPPHLFSWHPPPGDREEALEYGLIESVCRQEGLAPFWCPLSAEDVVAFLRNDVTLGQKVMAAMQESAVLRRAAELGVEVILSGWGGDEAASFNGRGYYQELMIKGRLVRLWREVSARSSYPLAYILARVALQLVLPRASLFILNVRRFRQWPRHLPQARPMRYTSVRSTQLALLLQGHIGRRAEGWAEAGARAGVEYRYPLLDRRLLRFALGLPPGMYRRGPWSRWIMRQALRSELPGEVLWNRTKENLVAEEQINRAAREAVPEIRRLLDSRSAPPARSEYLDLDRLMESLDKAASPRSPIPLTSLRFLDF